MARRVGKRGDAREQLARDLMILLKEEGYAVTDVLADRLSRGLERRGWC